MPGETFIQASASLHSNEFERAGTLRNHLQRYIIAYAIQTAQTAACNRTHMIGERLARWLLTCHDRVQSDRMSLTHEFLGQMLGAPRTTVTLTAGMLQQAGLIDYARGHVMIKTAENWNASLASVIVPC